METWKVETDIDDTHAPHNVHEVYTLVGPLKCLKPTFDLDWTKAEMEDVAKKLNDQGETAIRLQEAEKDRDGWKENSLAEFKARTKAEQEIRELKKERDYAVDQFNRAFDREKATDKKLQEAEKERDGYKQAYNILIKLVDDWDLVIHNVTDQKEIEISNKIREAKAAVLSKGVESK